MCPNQYIELQRSKTCHQKDSHAQDKSKKLTYKQLLAVRDAVFTAPQLSTTILQGNLDLKDSVHQEISAKQLPVFQLEDKF
jgi:hypothetical protein